MTLKEWADREGLSYVCPDHTSAEEYGVHEMVLVVRHCWDCADWYVWQDLENVYWISSPDGSTMDATPLYLGDLPSITKERWT